MSYVGSALRRVSRALVSLNRRVASGDLPGAVVERDESSWLVRLDLGLDPETGERVLSPWVAPRAQSAGAMKISAPLPPVGTPMRLVSPSGVVGAESYAEYVAYTGEHARPKQGADEHVSELGENRQSVTPDRWRVERTGEMKSAVDVRSEGRVVAEVWMDLAKLKIRVRRPHGDQWFKLRPEALLPTTENE
ncbi:MAG: hypothetical protein HZY79_15565 [Rhodoblastus sp.]|nr:MAG: hypothetical protein HZY79_15565 [Rhodoblastus sp.]